MKRNYPYRVMIFTHLHLGKLIIIFGVLLWFMPVLKANEGSKTYPFNLEPFNKSTCEDLVYNGIPLVDNPYDGKRTAYITNGQNDGSVNNLVKWLEAGWLECRSQGLDIGNPPNPDINKTDLYIQISAGDYIGVNTISYRNQITIVVCGYLEVGEFAVLEPIIFTQFNPGVGDDISINPSAHYESDFALMEGDFTYGFSIIPQAQGFDIFDPEHRIYPADSPFFNDTYWNETYDSTIEKYQGNFSFGNLAYWKGLKGEMITLVPDDWEEDVEEIIYEIVPFVEDEHGDALYFVTDIMSVIFSKNGTKEYAVLGGSEHILSEVKNDGVFLNNVNIIICPGGYLKATSLDLKNSVAIYNYGTLQAGSITGQGSASTQCIQGTGNFLNLDGEPIIFVDDSGVWHVDGNYVSDVYPDNHLGWTFGDNCNSPIIPLPIELYSFNSKVHPEHIELNWTTATEINNDFFTLERSSDLYTWEIVGFVQGAGTTSEKRHYSLNDYNPLDGVTYYRLKQTDFDGKFEYFGPLSVMYLPGAEGLDFRVVRHPDQWTIHVPAEGIYHVELYSLSGQRIYSGKVSQNLSIPAPSQTVVVRVFNDYNHSSSRVVMQ